SAQEQATALAQVNTAINEMDQVTQQNAAMVEETTAASHSLAQEADALEQSMANFKTGHVVQRAATGRRGAAAASAATSGHGQGHGGGARRSAAPVPQMRTTGRGGAAAKPNLAAAPEPDWQEF
ncbi:MAG: chemotaxis protein, partial [Alphaproteobacteria bacterium]|nr:chemotaxis protein [Alphaproteobacteria bacterium]